MSERGAIADLGVRSGIGAGLPAMFHDDEMIQRWCAGLDEVVAPVPSSIDSFWAYLDPMLAPLDFVEWLAQWVGLELDQTWSEPRRRELIATAHRLHDARGTAGGLADLIELYVGVRPTIEEPGSSTWSSTPGAEVPTSTSNELVVTVTVEDADSVDLGRLDELVSANKPAHLAHRVELVAGTDS